MKRIIVLGISCLFLANAFSASARLTKVPKGEMRQYKIEKEPTQVASEHDFGPITQHDNLRNSSVFTLVDSSQNGYGMWSSTTRPLYVDDSGWFSVYRQFWAPGQSHGRLGASYSEDGSNWAQPYANVNNSLAGARYPSAMGNGDYPYAVWNEYSAAWSPPNPNIIEGYGGMGFYSYDEFNWDGGSMSFPIQIDLAWTGNKDHWQGSPASATDETNGIEHFCVVYDDWTRDGYYMFCEEAYEDGYIIFETEELIFDEAHHFVGGTEDGSFNSSAVMSMNNDGDGIVGLIGIFAIDVDGVDCDPEGTADGDCFHTPIFKMTEDYGSNWHGSGDDYFGDYYHIPNNVWEDLMANSFSDYWDPCADTSSVLDDMWTYYNLDFKVDGEGNPHFLVEVLPCDTDFCYYSSGDNTDVGSGYYHFTIDRANLDNPGQVNSSTGWNYSYVVPARDTWAFADPVGDSMLWSTHAHLAFSETNSDIVWVVSDMAVKGPATEASLNPDDPYDCLPDAIFDEYPEWSEDVFVYKSEDGGQSWWNPLNATNTPDLTNGTYSPEEQMPHAFQFGTDDQVYIMFQMPDWDFNEIGDPMGVDFKNRVYVGYAEVTSNTEDPYPVEDVACALTGDVNNDGFLNILDIVSLVNAILGIMPVANEDCADFTGDGFSNILDIVSMVNCILGTGSCGDSLARVDDATEGSMIVSDGELVLHANGYVGAVKVTLAHDADFSAKLTDDALIAEMVTDGYKTTLIIVNPASDVLLTSGDAFSIAEVEVVNSVEYINISTATSYAIMSNYPNPFNPETTISYELFTAGDVSIVVYNMLGQQVAELMNEYMDAGSYTSVWNGFDSNGHEMPSGIYMLKLSAGNDIVTNKITLLR